MCPSGARVVRSVLRPAKNKNGGPRFHRPRHYAPHACCTTHYFPYLAVVHSGSYSCWCEALVRDSVVSFTTVRTLHYVRLCHFVLLFPGKILRVILQSIPFSVLHPFSAVSGLSHAPTLPKGGPDRVESCACQYRFLSLRNESRQSKAKLSGLGVCFFFNVFPTN